MNRPTIGILTKVDLADEQNVSRTEQWLKQAGAQQIFITSAVAKSGLDEIFTYLNVEALHVT